MSYLSDQQVKEAYLLEKKLAEKLNNASREDRKQLYNSVYEEYYEKFPQHPFVDRNDNLLKKSANKQLNYLLPFLKANDIFLEIGAGSGFLSIEAAKNCQKVYIVDVSDEPTKDTVLPNNVELIIYNGINIPSSIGKVDMVYSNQLMEHLHPDDAIEQLKDIYNSLSFEGIYFCKTPHCFSGPHDISKHFDDVATCLHLKEYTVSELINFFKLAGFQKIKYFITVKHKIFYFPIFIVKILENIIKLFPFSLRRILSRSLPLRLFFKQIVLVGIK